MRLTKPAFSENGPMMVHTSNLRCYFCRKHLTIIVARREPGCLDISATRGQDIAPALPCEPRFCSQLNGHPCCKIISERQERVQSNSVIMRAARSAPLCSTASKCDG